MKKMLNLIKNNTLFGIIIGGIIFGSIGVGATAYLYNSNEVSYSNSNSSSTNVKEALDELYTQSENKSFKIKIDLTSIVQSNSNNFVPSGGQTSISAIINCTGNICDFASESAISNFRPNSVSNGGSFKLTSILSNVNVTFEE